jgi:hypothetical protein
VLGLRLFGGGSVGFGPAAFGGLGDQSLFQGVGRNADVADFAVNQRLDALEIRHKAPLGDGGDVRADAALFLGFTTAPNVTALNRAFSCDFANSRHNSKTGKHTGIVCRHKNYYLRKCRMSKFRMTNE